MGLQISFSLQHFFAALTAEMNFVDGKIFLQRKIVSATGERREWKSGLRPVLGLFIYIPHSENKNVM